MTQERHRANFRQLANCTAEFHEFHAASQNERGSVECVICGGQLTRLAANFYYVGVRHALDAAQRYASTGAGNARQARARMQAEFPE